MNKNKIETNQSNTAKSIYHLTSGGHKNGWDIKMYNSKSLWDKFPSRIDIGNVIDYKYKVEIIAFVNYQGLEDFLQHFKNNKNSIAWYLLNEWMGSTVL